MRVAHDGDGAAADVNAEFTSNWGGDEKRTTAVKKPRSMDAPTVTTA